MAKVEAMNIIAVTAKNITSAVKGKGIENVNSDTSNPFEKVFVNKSDPSKQQEPVSGDKKIVSDFTQKEGMSVDPKTDYRRKKEFVSEVPDGQDAVAVAVTGGQTSVPVDYTQAAVVVAEMKTIIKDGLDTDDASVDRVLGNMGITVMDLLDPAVLKDFVLQLNGCEDATELLTNEQLMDAYQVVSDALMDYSEQNEDVITSLMAVLETPEQFGESFEVQMFDNVLHGETVEMPLDPVPEHQTLKAEEQQASAESLTKQQEVPAEASGVIVRKAFVQQDQSGAQEVQAEFSQEEQDVPQFRPVQQDLQPQEMQSVSVQIQEEGQPGTGVRMETQPQTRETLQQPLPEEPSQAMESVPVIRDETAQQQPVVLANISENASRQDNISGTEEILPENDIVDTISISTVPESEPETMYQSQEQGADHGGQMAEKQPSENNVIMSGTVKPENEAEEVQESRLDQLFTDRSETEVFREVRQDDELHHVPLFHENATIIQGNPGEVAEANFGSSARMLQAIDIVRQIGEQIRTGVTEATTRMEMQLNPESLGKVLLTVSSKEGMMTATFRVQSEEARQALESQMYTLRENLEAKNIKVESVDVQISDFSFSESSEAERQMQEEMEKRGKKKFEFFTDENETNEADEGAEQIRRQVMRDSGGSIDFTA